MKKIVFIALISSLTFTACSESKKNVSEKESTTEEITEKEEKVSSWEYKKTEDKMEGTEKHFACINSDNSVEFKFPYDGGSIQIIMLRNNKPKDNDVMLRISKGQYMSSFLGNRSVKVKFDDEKPMNFIYNMPDNGNSEVIFLNNESKFIEKIKKAKKVMIESPFYNEANSVFEYNVEGLEWDY